MYSAKPLFDWPGLADEGWDGHGLALGDPSAVFERDNIDPTASLDIPEPQGDYAVSFGLADDADSFLFTPSSSSSSLPHPSAALPAFANQNDTLAWGFQHPTQGLIAVPEQQHVHVAHTSNLKITLPRTKVAEYFTDFPRSAAACEAELVAWESRKMRKMSDTDSPSSETPEWVGKPESTGAPSRTRKKTSEESGSGGDDEEVPVRKHAKRKAPSKEPKKPKPTVNKQTGELLKKVLTRKKELHLDDEEQKESGKKKLPKKVSLANPMVYIKLDPLPPLCDGLRQDWDAPHADYAGSAVVVKTPFWLGNIWMSTTVSDLVAVNFLHPESINLAMQVLVMKHTLPQSIPFKFVHFSDFAQHIESTKVNSTLPSILSDMCSSSETKKAIFISVELMKGHFGLVAILPQFRSVLLLIPIEPNLTEEEFHAFLQREEEVVRRPSPTTSRGKELATAGDDSDDDAEPELEPEPDPDDMDSNQEEFVDIEEAEPTPEQNYTPIPEPPQSRRSTTPHVIPVVPTPSFTVQDYSLADEPAAEEIDMRHHYHDTSPSHNHHSTHLSLDENFLPGTHSSSTTSPSPEPFTSDDLMDAVDADPSPIPDSLFHSPDVTHTTIPAPATAMADTSIDASSSTLPKRPRGRPRKHFPPGVEPPVYAPAAPRQPPKTKPPPLIVHSPRPSTARPPSIPKPVVVQMPPPTAAPVPTPTPTLPKTTPKKPRTPPKPRPQPRPVSSRYTMKEKIKLVLDFILRSISDHESPKVEQTQPAWTYEVSYVPVRLMSERPVSNVSCMLTLGWIELLLKMMSSPVFDSHIAPAHKAKPARENIWGELQRGIRAFTMHNAEVLAIAPSCLSEPVSDATLEANWQGRLLWCIDRYQVDPEVRAITMLETPRFYEAGSFAFYTKIYLREKSSKGHDSEMIDDLKQDLCYVFSSRTVLEASERGRALYERLKATSDQQVLGRFSVKLFHYVMGLIYARSNVIWMDYRNLSTRPFSKTGFTITKTFYSYCSQYPQAYLLNFSFGHSTNNIVNIHHYLDKQSEDVQASWRQVVPVLVECERMYDTLFGLKAQKRQTNSSN